MEARVHATVEKILVYYQRSWGKDAINQVEDLRQEAWIAGAEVMRTFDPSRGFPFEGYAWEAMRRRLANFIMRSRAGGLGGTSNGNPFHDLRAVAFLPEVIEDTAEGPESCLGDAEWVYEARRLLQRVARRADRVDLLSAILQEEAEPHEVLLLSKQKLHRMRDKLTYYARQDRALKRLWEER